MVMTNIAIEHGPFIVSFPLPLKTHVIFHSYVSLPEGIASWCWLIMVSDYMVNECWITDNN